MTIHGAGFSARPGWLTMRNQRQRGKEFCWQCAIFKKASSVCLSESGLPINRIGPVMKHWGLLDYIEQFHKPRMHRRLLARQDRRFSTLFKPSVEME